MFICFQKFFEILFDNPFLSGTKILPARLNKQKLPQMRRTGVLLCISEKAVLKSDISSVLKVLLKYPSNKDQLRCPHQD